MTLDELQQKIDLDVKTALERFMGREDLLKRFLGKFTQDTVFSQLQDAMKDMDYNQIEFTAHTLKGAAATLGLNSLSKKASDIVESVRSGVYENIPQQFEALSLCYEETEEALKEFIK